MPLTPYRISDQAKQIARASGFDIENPHQRYPVKNVQMEQVLMERATPQNTRAALLLKGRHTVSRVFGRERGQ